jgi:hypothetical protein
VIAAQRDDMGVIAGESRQLCLHHARQSLHSAVKTRRKPREQLALAGGGDDDQRRVTQRPAAAGERLTRYDVDTTVAGRLGPGSAQLGRQRLRPRGKEAPPRVTAIGVDEHHAAGLVCMGVREELREKPAVGMADQDVRRRDPGAVEQSFEIPDLVARVVDARDRVAGAQTGPVVRVVRPSSGNTAAQALESPPNPASSRTVGLPVPLHSTYRRRPPRSTTSAEPTPGTVTFGGR